MFTTFARPRPEDHGILTSVFCLATTHSRTAEWLQHAWSRAITEMLLQSRLIERAYGAFVVARDELGLALLSPEQRSHATIGIYARSGRYSGSSSFPEAGFFDFEENALQQFFPEPPATVLVAGCGSGRELLALARRGFTVVGAYDPVPSFVESARRLTERIGAGVSFWVGTHESFAAGKTPLPGPVDAVVVGWTSYTHVLGGEARVSFLRALRRVGPRAPVLLSFFGPPEELRESPRDRLRRGLRKVLGYLPLASDREAGDAFRPGAGFVHFFQREETEYEAAAAGYRIAYYGEGGARCPHAVLVPTDCSSL
jgi:SAM-dependent methyltransferase